MNSVRRSVGEFSRFSTGIFSNKSTNVASFSKEITFPSSLLKNFTAKRVPFNNFQGITKWDDSFLVER